MLMVAHFICSFCTLVQSLITMYHHPFYLWKHVPVNWVNKIWSWLCSCTSKLIFRARDLLPWYTLVEPQAECTDLFLLKMKGLGKTCSHPYTIVFLPVSNVCHLISPFVNSNPNPACFTQWDTPGDYNIKSAVIRTTTQSSLQKQRQIYSLNSVCKFEKKKREFQISRSKFMWMRLCILPSLWYAKYWTLFVFGDKNTILRGVQCPLRKEKSLIFCNLVNRRCDICDEVLCFTHRNSASHLYFLAQ